MTGVKWDAVWLGVAGQISKRSKDPRTKVGAVIVSDDWRRISVGYNGFPAGVEDRHEVLDRCGSHEYGLLKDDLVVHAEMNAIIHCGERPQGWTIYTTHHPCSHCARHIVAAGIARVVTCGMMTTTDCGHDIAANIFRLSGVMFDIVKEPELSWPKSRGTSHSQLHAMHMEAEQCD